MTEQVTEAQSTEQQPPAAPEPTPPPQPEPESMKDFASKLVNEDGSLNEDAAREAEPERAQEAKKTPERGPDGKFVSSDPDKQKETQTEEGAARKADDTQEKDTEPEKGDKAKEGEEDKAETDKDKESDKTTRAPNSFNAKQREAFYALPPEQQEAVLDIVKAQDKDYTQKTQQIAEQRKALEPLERVLEPHKEKFAHMGARPEQVVDQLLTLADHADRDFVGFVREQARIRGIPLEAFGTQQQSGDGDNPNPENQALQQQNSRLEQRIDQLEQYIAQGEQQQQATALSSLEQVVNEVSSDTDNYPFFDELAAEMSPLITAIRAQNRGMAPKDVLAKAYKAAASLNDEVSAKIAADARARDEAARSAKAKEDAARALRAADSNVSGNGVISEGDGLSDDPKNMREFARREAARLMQS